MSVRNASAGKNGLLGIYFQGVVSVEVREVRAIDKKEIDEGELSHSRLCNLCSPTLKLFSSVFLRMGKSINVSKKQTYRLEDVYIHISHAD